MLKMGYFHDPIIAFALHMPLAWELCLLAALGIVVDLPGRRSLCLTFGATAFFGAALTYEATYAFVVVYLALIHCLVREMRIRTFAFVAYVMPPLFCSLAAIEMRRHVGNVAQKTYVANLDFGRVLRTLLVQSAGSLPLSYAFANPRDILPAFSSIVFSPQTGFVALIALVVTYSALARPAARYARADAVVVAAFAVLSIVTSSSLIALAPRWQNELILGLAYTPVYFAYYGVALLSGSLYVVLERGLSPAYAAASFAVLLASVTGMTYRTNDIAMTNYTAWNPAVLDAAVRNRELAARRRHPRSRRVLSGERPT